MELDNNLAWAAGFFEGEGDIGIDKRSDNPFIRVTNTDHSMLIQFRNAVNCGSVSGPFGNGLSKAGLHNQDRYQWKLHNLHDIQSLFRVWWPVLSDKRRNSIAKVIAQYYASSVKRRASAPITVHNLSIMDSVSGY